MYRQMVMYCVILYITFYFFLEIIVPRPLVSIRNALSEITENFKRIEYIFLLFCTERRAYLSFGGTIWPRVPTNMILPKYSQMILIKSSLSYMCVKGKIAFDCLGGSNHILCL